MTALKPAKRRQTARELAKKFGVSERTIRRTVAQPRAEYVADTHTRQDRALELRESGLKWREVGEQLGGITDSAAYQLAAKARIRRSENVTA
ncbi:HTH domain-containing protein [Devriesea agamarum]|uniref:HTH domain-containing protein n=1 Tax=Devriesea agamarum TaxID=472569 RepID=UPI00071E46AB|nr:HTH domain-containing protein [Devriesea agamarum]